MKKEIWKDRWANCWVAGYFGNPSSCKSSEKLFKGERG